MSNNSQCLIGALSCIKMGSRQRAWCLKGLPSPHKIIVLLCGCTGRANERFFFFWVVCEEGGKVKGKGKTEKRGKDRWIENDNEEVHHIKCLIHAGISTVRTSCHAGWLDSSWCIFWRRLRTIAPHFGLLGALHLLLPFWWHLQHAWIGQRCLL